MLRTSVARHLVDMQCKDRKESAQIWFELLWKSSKSKQQEQGRNKEIEYEYQTNQLRSDRDTCVHYPFAPQCNQIVSFWNIILTHDIASGSLSVSGGGTGVEFSLSLFVTICRNAASRSLVAVI